MLLVALLLACSTASQGHHRHAHTNHHANHHAAGVPPTQGVPEQGTLGGRFDPRVRPWDDMCRGRSPTSPERVAFLEVLAPWVKQLFTSMCLFQPGVPTCESDPNSLAACTSAVQPAGRRTKRYTRTWNQGWFAQVNYGNFNPSYHFIEPSTGGLCCMPRKLYMMARAYVKENRNSEQYSESVDKCQSKYVANVAQLGHLNRQRAFIMWCTFTHLGSQLGASIGSMYELNSNQGPKDNVCPLYVFNQNLLSQHSNDDSILIDFFVNTWYIPASTKEKYQAIKAERAARKAERKARC